MVAGRRRRRLIALVLAQTIKLFESCTSTEACLTGLATSALHHVRDTIHRPTQLFVSLVRLCAADGQTCNHDTNAITTELYQLP